MPEPRENPAPYHEEVSTASDDESPNGAASAQALVEIYRAENAALQQELRERDRLMLEIQYTLSGLPAVSHESEIYTAISQIRVILDSYTQLHSLHLRGQEARSRPRAESELSYQNWEAWFANVNLDNPRRRHQAIVNDFQAEFGEHESQLVAELREHLAAMADTDEIRALQRVQELRGYLAARDASYGMRARLRANMASDDDRSNDDISTVRSDEPSSEMHTNGVNGSS
ncbi:hypothetical protein EJ06DRAFT_558767 [Trichodelitschia bisporula]|uniref:Uncharacterized protein n=1 Tax=Trichodelitschia bisporula TaxID=703511 RepID=A0A6G1HPM3_9PEZI|nr:hypothetical protein EJ06DRAFT_558767 [Trichodelitschia bisporula]